MKQHSRRSSLQSQKNQTSQEPAETVTCTPLQKAQKYITLTYGLLRTHRKQQKYRLDPAQLEDLYKTSAAGLKMLKKGRQEVQIQSGILKQQLEHLKLLKKKEIKQINEIHQQQIKIIQSETNRKILDMGTQFGRKEQQYRQIISKFMKALTKAQQIYQKTYIQLNNKCHDLIKIIKKKEPIQLQNKQVYEIIKHIGQDIALKRDNSVISRKQDDISFDQIDLSEKIISYPKQVLIDKNDNKLNHKITNTNFLHQEEGQIQQMEQIQINYIHNQPSQNKQQLEQCIQRLVCFGFFCSENQSDVIKMFNITKNLNNYMELLKEPIFPILIDKLKLNVQKTLIIVDSVNSSVDNSLEDAVQLRNIQNISELSVNDSNLSIQVKFRKKLSPQDE